MKHLRHPIHFLTMLALGTFWIGTGCWPNVAQSQASDQSVNTTEQRVRATVQTLFEANQSNPQRPPLVIRKVALDSGFALVVWELGESGGVALLQQQKDETWKVLLRGGGWAASTNLIETGVPKDIAERLLTTIDPNWRNFEPAASP